MIINELVLSQICPQSFTINSVSMTNVHIRHRTQLQSLLSTSYFMHHCNFVIFCTTCTFTLLLYNCRSKLTGKRFYWITLKNWIVAMETPIKKIAPLSDLSSYLASLPYSSTSFWYQPMFLGFRLYENSIYGHRAMTNFYEYTFDWNRRTINYLSKS